MNVKIPACCLVVFSLWIGLFAPFAFAQNMPDPQLKPQPNGLHFRISEAAKENAAVPLSTPVRAENLTESEASAIFERLPNLPENAEEKAEFRMRSDSLKPPRTGGIVPIKFPANETRNAPNLPNAKADSLRIERFSPEGKTSLVSDLSVTFSQPMVSVSSQTGASEENVPVVLTPKVKGKWRWAGTQTLIFDSETRFPMATTFTAKIPKGTKSAVGGTLSKEVSWTFSTPPPKIETFVPKADDKDVYPEYRIMAAKFNQEIDEREILPKIKLFVDGRQLAIKSVTAEIDTNYTVYRQLGEVKPKHWLAFRPVDVLPLNAEVKVVFAKGLPSAEGAGISETEQSFSFKTLGPFALSAFYCGYSQPNPEKCQPSDDFRLQFNRSLSPGKFEPSLVRIEPPIENAEIYTDGSQSVIHIKGKKQPNTTYQVTLSGEAIDFYKIKVGRDISAVFNVGIDNPKFFAQGGDFVTLDPNAKPVFSVYSKNQPKLNIRLYSVMPEDYWIYRQLLEVFYQNQEIVPTPNFGKLIFDKTIETNSEIDALTETRINLSEVLPGKFGHAILIAEPIIKTANNYENRPVFVWIQSTNIGIDASIDYEQLTAFATDLQTAKPLDNARVSVYTDKRRILDSMTDETGIADLKLPPESGEFLLVKSGTDSAILAQKSYYYRLFEDAGRRMPYDFSRWFVFDDRKMYRPNEEVSIKGYIRTFTGGKSGDIAAIGDRIKTVNYILRDPRNNEISRGTATLNAFGAFDFNLKLPENINLGYQRLEFWSREISGSPDFGHTFQVQEFRRPEFEVTVAAETPAPFLVGTSATISAEAKYYTGGFLMNTEVNWSIAAFGTKYSPPGHESFNFGGFFPWWRNFSENMPRGNYSPFPGQNTYGKTDAEGKDHFKIDFLSANPAYPYTLRAVAEIQDVNRQTIADTKTFLVHPSEVYVGLRSSKAFVRQNEALSIEALATDIDGKTIENAPISIKAELKDWKNFGSTWREVVVDTQNCSLTSAVNKAVSCEFTAKQGGVFEFTAIVLDAKQRPNTSNLEVWVAGGNTPPKRDIEQENVELIPDKKEYFPDDTAEILVNAPFFPAEGVLTLERGGIIKTERFTMNSSSTVLQIPIEERFLPNIHVKVELVGIAGRTNDAGEIDKTLPKRPAFAVGDLNLNISKATRKLNVSVEPVEKTVEPGAETAINIQVRDNLGKPVAGSEVAVIAVDEAVLALTDYKIENPLEAFYKPIGGNVQHYRSREKVLLGNKEDINDSGRKFSSSTIDAMQLEGMTFQTDGVKGTYKKWAKNDVAYIISEKEKSQINVRRNFDALAIFSPSVTTDENGKAVVDLKLPDNLTRYRITAVAATKTKQFGSGESNVTAKQSLQARPSAPRFMNFGDRAEIPVVLQNQTDSAMTVNVAIRAVNANLTGGNGKKVTVAANDRVEIRFPVSTEKSGAAQFQIGAVSGEFTDAAEITFPIYTPATSEAFATYGTTEADGAIVQSISAPKDVFSDFGGLEITTSSTQLQELTDAFIYLQNYPFDCTEQISSRVLSVAALRDVLEAFEVKDLPTKERIQAKMKSDLERLQVLQHFDGGFSFWRSDDQSIPYVSVHVAHAIARARAKDYVVSNDLIARSLSYLRTVEAKYPESYSAESRWAISAYALYVRDLFGEKDAAKAKKLLQEAGLDKLSAESLGWILPVLADDKNSAAEFESIKRNLLNRVTETAGNAHFVTTYKDGEYVLLSSERRADGIILEALLKTDPNNTLIPKIVRGLLSGRLKGRWGNTQENAFVLLALDKYFHVFEKETPDFIAKIWLGKAFAGEQKFAGRSVDSNVVNVPMDYLQKQSAAQNLVLDKQGAGRLYYRIGMKYAPKNLKLDAADYGFIVSRSYEAIDNQEDVKQNADGSWTIKSGARVRVNLKTVAPTRRYHVALVDNLPAGIEIINPGLAVSGNNYVKYFVEKLNNYFPVEHQNFRDNRAEVFSTLLRDGIYHYSYLARATTPGNFVVPPAKAEEMYAPETFGRSRTDFVKIE